MFEVPHGCTFMRAIAAVSCFEIVVEEKDRNSMKRFEACRLHFYIHLLNKHGYSTGDAPVVLL